MFTLTQDDKSCDVAFIVDNKFEENDTLSSKERIETHKQLLIAKSPVFEAMFSDRWSSTKPDEMTVVELTDILPCQLKNFLKFVQTEQLETTESEYLTGIILVAQKYLMESIFKRIEQILLKELASQKTQFNPKKVLHFYQLAREFQLNRVTKAAMSIIAVNCETLIDSDAFLEMDVVTLENLLNRNDLSVREIVLFHAMMRWAGHRSIDDKELEDIDSISITERPKLRETQGAASKKASWVIPFIRFVRMEEREFKSEVVPYKVLSETHLEAIFKYFSLSPYERSSFVKTTPYLNTLPHRHGPKYEFYHNHQRSGKSGKWTVTYLDQVNHEETLSFLATLSNPNKGNSVKPAINCLVFRGPSVTEISVEMSMIHKPINMTLPKKWIVTVTIRQNDKPTWEGASIIMEIKEKVLSNDEDTFIMLDQPVQLESGLYYFISTRFHTNVITANAVKYHSRSGPHWQDNSTNLSTLLPIRSSGQCLDKRTNVFVRFQNVQLVGHSKYFHLTHVLRSLCLK